MELNKKQICFCEEYIIDLNGKQAAIRSGYSPKTADVQASRLLTNAKLRQKISDLQQKRSERTEISADKVLNELYNIAFSQVTDFIRVEEHFFGRGKKKRSIRAAVAQLTHEIGKGKLSAIAEIKQTAHGIGIKLHSKEKALELLGKHLGLFKEIHEHTGKDGKPIQVASSITHNINFKKCDK